MSRRTELDDRRSVSTRKRISKAKPSLYLNSNSNIDVESEIWSKDFIPESPPPLQVARFDEQLNGISITQEESRNRQVGKSHSFESLQVHHKTFKPIAVSVVKPQDISVSESWDNRTSTLFQDPQHPITIVLTTPEDELQESTYTYSGPQKSISTTPLQALPSQRQVPPNSSLLMPPTERNAVESRKTRQSREFREIRKWLISFLNAKSESLPQKLRARMMDIYAIRECDLDEEVVARWRVEEDEEGLTLELTEGVGAEGGGTSPLGEQEEWDQKESLRMLGMALRRDIEEKTPMRRSTPTSGPLPPTRQQSAPGTPTSPQKNHLSRIPDDEELPTSASPHRHALPFSFNRIKDFKKTLLRAKLTH